MYKMAAVYPIVKTQVNFMRFDQKYPTSMTTGVSGSTVKSTLIGSTYFSKEIYDTLKSQYNESLVGTVNKKRL